MRPTLRKQIIEAKEVLRLQSREEKTVCVVKEIRPEKEETCYTAVTLKSAILARLTHANFIHTCFSFLGPFFPRSFFMASKTTRFLLSRKLFSSSHRSALCRISEGAELTKNEKNKLTNN